MTNGMVPEGAAAIRAALAKHGYGLQYRVIKECLTLRAERKSVFRVDGIEYPVRVNDVDLHIDFLLRSKRTVLVVECKRVDPAYATWCFARSSLSSAGTEGSLDLKRVVFEWMFFHKEESRFTVGRNEGELSELQYHVAFEVKNNDVSGSGTGKALDAAVTQALRGASGIIAACGERPALVGSSDYTLVVPVIVTTARLVTYDTDLASSDLALGLPSAEGSMSERPWVWLRNMASAGVRHRHSWHTPRITPGSFGQHQEYAYARSVGVVNVHGLEEFLGTVSRVHTGDMW